MMKNGKMAFEGEIGMSVEQLRAAKLSEINAACESEICSDFDVYTSEGA